MSATSIYLPPGFTEGTYFPILDTSGVLPANYISPEEITLTPNAGGECLSLIPSYAPFFAVGFSINYTSDNLFANGGPFANTSGWDSPAASGSYGGGVVSVDGTAIRLTNDATSTHFGVAEFSIPTIIGEVYSIYMTEGLSSDPSMHTHWWKSDAPYSGSAVLLTDIGGGQFNFTATATTSYVSFTTTSSAALGWIDVVSVVVNRFKWLTSGIDFYFAYPFIGATRAIGQPIYGGIKFIDLSLSGTMEIQYQTLGGIWISTQANIAATLATNPTIDPCGIAWEQVNNFPNVFPTITTPWNMLDQTPLSSVVSNLEIIRENVSTNALALNYGSEIAHMVNMSNPHAVSTTQVGLNLVSNYPPATNVDALNPAISNEYINAAQVNSMMHTGLAQATSSLAGVMRLNQGITTSDNTEATSALTAAGFASLISRQDNAIGLAFNLGQQIGYVLSTPTTYPYTWNSVEYFNLYELTLALAAGAGTLTLPAVAYPLTWNGTVCATQADFIAAVEAAVNVLPLEYNSVGGYFWFPDHITIPSLVIVHS